MAKRKVRRRQGDAAPAELQLTPMIDIVFQLLVFFLCATKFPEPEGVLRSWLPKDKGQSTTIPDIDPGSVRLILRMAEGRITCQYEDDSSPTGFTMFNEGQLYDFQLGRDEVVPIWEDVERHLVAARTRYQQRGGRRKRTPGDSGFFSRCAVEARGPALEHLYRAGTDEFADCGAGITLRSGMMRTPRRRPRERRVRG